MTTAPEQASKPSGDWSRLLPDKVVIVTGAGGAIGSAIAHTCALHGARVVVADVNKNTAEVVATKIISEDASKTDYVMAMELDIANEQSIQTAIKTIVDKWNTVDVLVNKYISYLIELKIFDLFFLVLLFLHLVQLKL
jgi:saccharopine dehydrogenase-like NADP-dependent oxidoreductase